MKSFKEVYDEVEKRLSKARVYHSKCVAVRCVELADKYGVDQESAKMVGIIHDIAQEMPNDEKIKYCREHSLEVDEIERLSPGLLHGKIGAHIAKTEFGYSEDLCSAIRYHSTGKEKMSLLDKILYVADMSSQDRDFPDKDHIIKLADKNLDECVKYILKVCITELMEKNKKIHFNSIKALNYLNN